MDSRLKAEIQEIIRQTVAEELQNFYETQIEPIKKQLEELDRRVDHEFELPPPHRNPSSIYSEGQKSNSSSKVSIGSPSLLQRVSSKVASTTSSFLHGNFDGDSHSSRDSSPSQSPLSLAMDSIYASPSNSAGSATSAVTAGAGVGAGIGATNAKYGTIVSPVTTSSSSASGGGSTTVSSRDLAGPVTVRRNSGVTRAADSRDNLNDFVIPITLQEGLPFLRVTHKKKVQRILRIDKDAGVVSWNTKQSSRLYIDRICEIYVGEEARNYREEFRISAEHSQRWATIIHQRPKETKLRALHLIVSSQKDFDAFILSMLKLVKFRREIMSGLAMAGQNFVDMQWNLNSKSSGFITFPQVLTLTRQLHIHCARPALKAMFDEADQDKSHYLDFDEFRDFVKLLKRRTDIQAIYDQYKIGESTANLVTFYEEVQHQPLPPSVQLPLTQCPTVEEFGHMLLAPLHSTQSPVDADLPSLSLPLNNYFICSSHNTYLMGRQLADNSSIESCIRALQDGCRCLELDCWDASNNGGSSPLVHHGHGLAKLTSSVVFSDVVEAILKYAFISTPFPLILSLEVRCGENSQLQIVSILKNILAGLLVTERLPGDDGERLPSPNALKHRILVKVKGAAAPETQNGGDEVIGSPKQAASIHPALAELGVYFSGRKFPGNFLVGPKPRNLVYSFSERTFKALVSTAKKTGSVEEYNKQHFSRVYPAALRVTSSNFDPLYFWKRGVQMVALNWQTFDLGMQLNTAFFSNRVGYVLKPRSMRDASAAQELATNNYDPTAPSSVFSDQLVGLRKLEVTIISAQQLPRPKFLKEGSPFSPYVTLEAFGLDNNDALSLSPQWRTPGVFDNGFNPLWNHKCSLFIRPDDFDFACLRFTLAVEGQPFAYHVCRIANMSPGYRHVPLVDLQGEDFIFSSLFIKNELVPVDN